MIYVASFLVGSWFSIVVFLVSGISLILGDACLDMDRDLDRSCDLERLTDE